MNSKITKQLVENIALLQEVHQLNHQIEEIQFSCMPTQRKRWTKTEDQLLYQAVMVFGPQNLEHLSNVVLSKTPTQIYFRVRYIINNPAVYQARKIMSLE
ncbi:SANT/Myb_domain [Hexamita inflata]|uniref:SANT/Myb domain n=1 Tax=Hexamita inflata TaxID=28002 RepID=A0AA86QN47_9EUKA|nr:SANT/Myb domain [Hexamita inflata]